ncbi:MAG: hypothetical protein BMS9Abin11_0133 [Gammaproteobacteria bacterium]|nr:MAG: hypothetical protein BMS9Abin11_0133 [Gammaproteobacteria bacterium]
MDNRKQILIWILGAWLLATPLTGFGEAGSARLKIDMREQPSIDSKVVTNINKKQKLDIINRLGSWVHVKTEDSKTGWLRLHQVRIGDGRRKNNSGYFGLGRLFGSFSGKQANKGITAATGIRGLEAAQIRDAKADHAAVKAMDEFMVVATDALGFAEKNQLIATKVPYLKKDRKRE